MWGAPMMDPNQIAAQAAQAAVQAMGKGAPPPQQGAWAQPGWGAPQQGGWQQGGGGGGQGFGKGGGGGNRLCFNTRDYGRCVKGGCTFRHEMTPEELKEHGHVQNAGGEGHKQLGNAAGNTPAKKVVGQVVEEVPVKQEDPGEGDLNGVHVDYERLEGKPNVLTLMVTDREEILYPAVHEVKQENGTLLPDCRLAPVPAECQMEMKVIGQLTSGKAVKHDGTLMGLNGKKRLQEFIAQLRNEVKTGHVIMPPKQLVTITEYTPEKGDISKFETMVGTMMSVQNTTNQQFMATMMEQNKAVFQTMTNLTTQLAQTPRGGTGSMHSKMSPAHESPLLRKSRKQARLGSRSRTRGTGAASSTTASTPDNQRYGALFGDEDSSSDSDSDPLAGIHLDNPIPPFGFGPGAPPAGGQPPAAAPVAQPAAQPPAAAQPPPAQVGGGLPAYPMGPPAGTEAAALAERESRSRLGFTAVKEVTDHFDAIVDGIKRVGGAKHEWSANDLWDGVEWMKPAKEAGPNDVTMEFDAPDMGRFGILFHADDYRAALGQGLAKVITALEESKRGTERGNEMLKAYGIKFKGKATKKRTCVGLSLAIARNSRQNP